MEAKDRSSDRITGFRFHSSYLKVWALGTAITPEAFSVAFVATASQSSWLSSGIVFEKMLFIMFLKSSLELLPVQRTTIISYIDIQLYALN